MYAVVGKILSVLEDLDRYVFDKMDPNTNCLDVLAAKIWGSCQPGQGVTSQDEAVVSILCEWAVTNNRYINVFLCRLFLCAKVTFCNNSPPPPLYPSFQQTFLCSVKTKKLIVLNRYFKKNHKQVVLSSSCLIHISMYNTNKHRGCLTEICLSRFLAPFIWDSFDGKIFIKP